MNMTRDEIPHERVKYSKATKRSVIYWERERERFSVFSRRVCVRMRTLLFARVSDLPSTIRCV